MSDCAFPYPAFLDGKSVGAVGIARIAADRPAPLSPSAASVPQDHLLPPQDGRLQGDDDKSK